MEKEKLFNNISTCDITNDKTFWKTVKTLFTDTVQTKSKIEYSLQLMDTLKDGHL